MIGMIEPHLKPCQGTPAWAVLIFGALMSQVLPGQHALKLTLGQGSSIRFTTPAPALFGEERLPEPAFNARGNAVVAGLHLKRIIEKVNGGYRIRLSMTNGRSKPVELKSLIPLQVAGANLTVAGTSIQKWTVFRLARHKNDIPGPFRPTLVDDAWKDAATDNSGGTSADDPSRSQAAAARFHSDPGFVVMPGGQPAVSHLFIGFDGQTEHLNDLLLEVDKDQLSGLSAVAEFDGVLVPPGGVRETHPLYIQTGKDVESLLADHVERIRKRYGSRLADHRNIFCTWYFYGPEILADDLRRDLAEIKRRPVLFDTFLIDYGWSDKFGDWNALASKFPKGMNAMADEIRAAGLTPGIWSCPFLVKPDSEALRQYPDLPLKTRTGQYVNFGMRDMGEFYVVDPTSPSAEKFLTETVRKLRGWGYQYLKFDFVRAIVLNDNAVFHDRSVNRAQAYRRGMEILRKATGDDGFIGVWGGLYEANAGLVEINRSGSDVRGHWDPIRDYGHETRYPVRMRQTFARSFYDEKLWTSDQDALQLRRRTSQWRNARPHLSMGLFTDEEAFSTVVYRFLGGGVVQVSEKLDELDQDRYELYKMVIPTFAPVARRFGVWDQYLPEQFVSHFSKHPSLPSWSVVTLTNWNGKDRRKIGFVPSDVPGLPKAGRYAAFEFRTQKFLGVFTPQARIEVDLEAHAARVIRLTPITLDGTWLIGTDLNLSCGMELAQVSGKNAVLKPELAGFKAKATFLTWKDGKTSLEVAEIQ